VRMAKSVASGNGDPGGVLVYQLVLSNAGTRDAAGVSVQETVPQLTTLLPGNSSPGWTCSPNNNAGSSCTLSVGTLAAGAAATYIFAVQVASTFPANPPAIDNTACASTASAGDPSGNNCGTTSTPPGGNPDLAMAKSVASGSGNPGSVLVYQLVVSNAGTRDAAGVSLGETGPQLTSFLAAGSSPGWTCSPDGSAGSSCLLAMGTVAAGSSATFTFAVQVASTSRRTRR
jgi:large repetitive protein